MEQIREQVKAELSELGFNFISTSKCIGQVPRDGDILGFNIDVEIDIAGFPLKKPTIRLIAINKDEQIYKVIPPDWRHIDELMINNDYKSTLNLICCLHNWRAKLEYDGRYIYERVCNWLEANVHGNWPEDEDLYSWRLTPQFSIATLYLTENIVDYFGALEPGKFHSVHLIHSKYNFSGGTASGNKLGNEYMLNNIKFNRPYSFIPEIRKMSTKEQQVFTNLVQDPMESACYVLRLLSHFKFKSIYQLLRLIQVNFTSKVHKQHKLLNAPIIVVYRGESKNFEAFCFLVSKEFFDNKESYDFYVLKIETLLNKQISINLDVGLMGVGSLGSYIARILYDKNTTQLLISDPDIVTATNLGTHELTNFHLGSLKAKELEKYLQIRYSGSEVSSHSDDDLISKSEILIVTVGDEEKFDILAFEKLKQFDKPIIWVWTSPFNILQEIVITTPSTGCLNCYYAKIQNDLTLKSLQDKADEEIKKNPAHRYDYCGNPHVISQVDRMFFLATQVVSIISYFSKHKSFKFDYLCTYWGLDDIMPTMLTGFNNKKETCFC